MVELKDQGYAQGEFVVLSHRRAHQVWWLADAVPVAAGDISDAAYVDIDLHRRDRAVGHQPHAVVEQPGAGRASAHERRYCFRRRTVPSGVTSTTTTTTWTFMSHRSASPSSTSMSMMTVSSPSRPSRWGRTSLRPNRAPDSM